jgi:cell wall-associated NlpC family hydrolase
MTTPPPFTHVAKFSRTEVGRFSLRTQLSSVEPISGQLSPHEGEPLSLLSKIILAAAGTVILFAVFIANAVTALVGAGQVGGRTVADCRIAMPSSTVSGYSREQVANAATIVAVGKRMQVPEHGLVTAVVAALQESGLRNLNHGDRDSLGLFQQRPSQGWGTPAEIMNPSYAATTFYQRLIETPGWQEQSVNDAAQSVQRSGTPNAYGRHEPDARTLVAAVHGAACPAPAPPDGAAAERAITFAHAQIGRPYLWGGDGPEAGDAGFDCSGLVAAAYASAGVQLPRTAHTQYHATTRVPESELRPGDLVFYGNPDTKIHHVGLYIGAGQMIDAPSAGKPIGTRSIHEPTGFASGGRVR